MERFMTHLPGQFQHHAKPGCIVINALQTQSAYAARGFTAGERNPGIQAGDNQDFLGRTAFTRGNNRCSSKLMPARGAVIFAPAVAGIKLPGISFKTELSKLLLQIVGRHQFSRASAHAAGKIGGNMTNLLLSKVPGEVGHGLSAENNAAAKQYGQAEKGRHVGFLVDHSVKEGHIFFVPSMKL
ncbi:hypothetical protein PAJ_2330 [Pantoea ananatis AJ13355]|uniref:Uncharacterized protein n=1 Tax=Pantoea ananatis (strain AJ13355) TaxID=932677 RepID=A0A0H3KZ96_PANAA|nr:hypothetical protein PAJ_2330 [Pantoea ananatis AJ13355]